MSEDNSRKSGKKKTPYKPGPGKRLAARHEADILSLHVQGYSNKQISDFTQKTPSQVHKFLSEYGPLWDAIQHVGEYRNMRVQMLDGIEALLLKSICKSLESDKVSLKDAVFAFDKITNSRRLEQGLATSININQVRFTKVTEETLGDKVIDITPPTGKESE